MTLPPLTSLAKRLRYGASIDPVRDWLVLLIVAALAFIGIVAWNIWAFDTVAGGGTIGSPAPVAPPAFSQSSLDTIRAIFASRAAEEAKYADGTYSFADPSH